MHSAARTSFLPPERSSFSSGAWKLSNGLAEGAASVLSGEEPGLLPAAHLASTPHEATNTDSREPLIARFTVG